MRERNGKGREKGNGEKAELKRRSRARGWGVSLCKPDPLFGLGYIDFERVDTVCIKFWIIGRRCRVEDSNAPLTKLSLYTVPPPVKLHLKFRARLFEVYSSFLIFLRIIPLIALYTLVEIEHRRIEESPERRDFAASTRVNRASRKAVIILIKQHWDANSDRKRRVKKSKCVGKLNAKLVKSSRQKRYGRTGGGALVFSEFSRNFPIRRPHKFRGGSTSMHGEHIEAAVSRLQSNPFVCDPENG